MMSKRQEKNWLDEIEPGETVQGEGGKPMVTLRGLRRLARLAGLNGSRVAHNHISIGSYGVFQCIYTALFDDGTTWEASADCSKTNTEGVFLDYPTAVAESRAAARCLKDALGITMLAAEEIAFEFDNGPKPDGKIDSQVVRMLEVNLNRKNVDVATLLSNVLNKTRSEEVFELEQLTVSEGQEAVRWINNSKPNDNKSKKKSRDARKEELKRKIGES